MLYSNIIVCLGCPRNCGVEYTISCRYNLAQNKVKIRQGPSRSRVRRTARCSANYYFHLRTCSVPKQYKIHQPPICLFPPIPYFPLYRTLTSLPSSTELDQNDQRYGSSNQAYSAHFCSTQQVHPDGCVARRLSACIGGSAERQMRIDALNPASTVSSQHEHQHKARRLRGGGAGRVGPVPYRILPCAPLSSGSALVLIDAPRRASISPLPSSYPLSHRMLT